MLRTCSWVARCSRLPILVPLSQDSIRSCSVPMLQACTYLLGTPLSVFYVVGMGAALSALPFLFVASPTPPPRENYGDGETSSLGLSKKAKVGVVGRV